MKVWVLLGAVTTVLALAIGCADSPDGRDDTADDAGGPSRSKDASTHDRSESTEEDASEEQPTKDSSAKPAEEYGDAGTGTECYFNAECQKSLRCECDEDTGCSCQPGTRGTGAAGASCASGNDCASSVCIDETTCSAACDSEDDCPSSLPYCIAVFGFPKKICTPTD